MRTHERYSMITKGLVPLAVQNPSRSWKSALSAGTDGTSASGVVTEVTPPLESAATHGPPQRAAGPPQRAALKTCSTSAPPVVKAATPAPSRGTLLGVATGAIAMVCVGGSVA